MRAHVRCSDKKATRLRMRVKTTANTKRCQQVSSSKRQLSTRGVHITDSTFMSGDQLCSSTRCVASVLGDSAEFTPFHIDNFRCQARIWADGHGGQCPYKPLCGSTMCALHKLASGCCKFPPHGFVTGEIPSMKLFEFKRVRAFRQSQSLGQLIYLEERFHQLAQKRLATFFNEFMCKRAMYHTPAIGVLACEYMGKTETSYPEIRSTDIVAYKWSYTCQPKQGVVIAGALFTYHNAHRCTAGKLSPKAMSFMIDVLCVAKIYQQLSHENAPFIRRHCHNKGNAVNDCELLAIGSPKPLSTMPVQKEFCDKHGNIAMWIVCAHVGKTNQVHCHPGASTRYATNRLSYHISELKIFDLDKDTPATSEAFKRRKRKVHCSPKSYKFPSTLEEVNNGLHQGLRLVVAYAVALAAATNTPSRYLHKVQFGHVMSCLEMNPFQWQQCGHWNKRVVVVWQCLDGTIHLQCGRLSYFMRLVCKNNLQAKSVGLHAEVTAPTS